MAKVPEIFNVGSIENLNLEDILVRMQEMYRTLAIQLNRKIELVERNTDGLTTDVTLSNGTVNINKSTNNVEMLVEHPTISTVTWKAL